MTHFDLTGIGNAIVDIISPCTDDFLTQNAIEKGAMTLIDQDRAQSLYDAMDTSTETAGGSAGNTMVGFASFGGKGNYIGLVANDSLGDSFVNDTRQNGLHFNTPRFEGLLSTATSHIFVTPDGERSMNTYLGACAELSENYIDESQIANSAITYMEGYLFDKDPAKAAFKKSAAIAHKNQRKVSLTLSDSFCVDRHRKDFMDLIKSDIDILFANDMELMALLETDNLDDALQAVQSFCAISAITRADKGSIILHDNEKTLINVERVSKVVDSTGAGDQYAAGFLYGLTQGKSMNECGQYASMAASEVISHIGPRPNITYKDLIKAA